MENLNKKNKFLPQKKHKKQIKDEPIYVMTIELEQGKNGNLAIYLDSNPEELSFNFCKQYNLDYSSMDFLKNQITKYINEFLNSEKHFSPTIEEVDEESTRQINNLSNNNININKKNFLNYENKNLNNDDSKIKNNNSNIKNNSNINKGNNEKNNYIKIENQKDYSPKKKVDNLITKKHNINPEKMIRKNPNLNKNKQRKFIELKHNKKEQIPVPQSTKIFTSINKKNINPSEHTLFSYERFLNNIKEKMNKVHSRNKSYSNQISRTNLKNHKSLTDLKNKSLTDLKNKSFTNLKNNKTLTNLKSFSNNISLTNLYQISKNKDSLNLKPFSHHKKITNVNSFSNSILTTYNLTEYNKIDKKNNSITKLNKPYKKSPYHNKIKTKIYKDIQKNSFTNTGERLYEKGVKLVELENKRINELKENLLKDINNESYTFKPKINSNTTLILEESKKNRINYKNDKSLLNYKDILDKKMKKLKDKYKEEEYSFIPTFNSKSLKIENKKHLSKKERINIMYKSKEKNKKRLKQIETEMYQNCSFKPEFTDYSKGNLINKSFEERQKIYYIKSKEKRNKLYQEINEPFDNKTGQEFFTPVINENNNNTFYLSRSKDVFDYLYSKAEKKMDKSNTQKSFSNLEKKNLSIDDSSNKIYEKKKYKTFEKIFDLLDSDNDNKISNNNIEISKIPKNVIKVLNPLIEEVKNSEDPIFKDDFIEGCFKLYQVLNFDDKQTIMRFPENENRIKKLKELTPNFPFKPKINKNSDKISNYFNILNSSINKTSDEYKDTDSSYINYLKQALSHNSLS